MSAAKKVTATVSNPTRALVAEAPLVLVVVGALELELVVNATVVSIGVEVTVGVSVGVERVSIGVEVKVGVSIGVEVTVGTGVVRVGGETVEVLLLVVALPLPSIEIDGTPVPAQSLL
jgi:hypothetical protein